jgi:hypothetical protein
MDQHGKGAATRSRSGRIVAAAGLALAFTAGSAIEAYAQRCKPSRPRPPVVISHMGLCEFDPETMSFAGKPAEQAMCLMRAAEVSRNRNVGPMLEGIPSGIASRVGQTTGLPDRDALAAHLVELGLVWDYAPFLWTPLARARDNDMESPQVRYFVIHDTSSPFIGGRPFPSDIDENQSINNLARYDCKDDWALAHVFINRGGKMLLSRELSEPWRATKFERATVFEGALKGLFLHVELVQPRGSLPGRGRNDARAPDPGFSQAQYDRLALVYVLASVRADRWLIPAFHAALDSGIRGGHDDPQNFDIDTFATSIDTLVDRLMQGPAAVASVTIEAAPEAAASAEHGSTSVVRASLGRQAASPTMPAIADAPAIATSGAASETSATVIPATATLDPPPETAVETPTTAQPVVQHAAPAPKQQAWKQQAWKQPQAWKRQGWKRQSWKRQAWQRKSYRSRYVSSKPKSRHRR